MPHLSAEEHTPGLQGRWPMVRGGKSPPYQLPGIIGGFSCSQILLQEQTGPNSSPEARQFVCNSLHQSPRRDKVISPLLLGDRSMGLMPGEKDFLGCISCARYPEHNCRQSFKVCGRPTRLGLELRGIQESQLTLGTHASGSLYNKDFQTALPVLQLETPSPGRSDRCFHSDIWANLKGFANPFGP